jgi:pimeloyl-ACP methyl ester carboxylesterase
LISEATKALVDGVAAEAERCETPCGDGSMVWRCWGSGPPLVLLHGGYGSWSHWIRNVLPLSRSFRVIAPDLPGLGESATPPEPWTAEGLAAIIVDGLAAIAPPSEELRLAGFSFGGVIARSPTPLRRVPQEADEAEEFATHRYNLNQLMIADPDKIDELALYLQKTNHARARMRSRRFSRSGALVEALPKIRARLDGIWGERDATAYPHLDERARILRSVQPAARFAVVPGAGHWVQYEAAERFNPLLAEFAGG